MPGGTRKTQEKTVIKMTKDKVRQWTKKLVTIEGTTVKVYKWIPKTNSKRKIKPEVNLDDKASSTNCAQERKDDVAINVNVDEFINFSENIEFNFTEDRFYDENDPEISAR